MDLGAYTQIEELEDSEELEDKIAELNGIQVPRLRDYRLMKNEKPLDFIERSKDIPIECVDELCCSRPLWNPNPDYWTFNWYTNYLKEYYLVTKKNENGCKEFVGVRWDRIHGKKRRILKTMIHNRVKEIKTNYLIFNKYIGREDILYIYARIGGGNWKDYFKDVVNQPWFIEKVDDPYDNTYCDIYAKITKFPENNEVEENK